MHIDIDPVPVVLLMPGKNGVLLYCAVNRIFKGIGVPWTVEYLIPMGRRGIYFEVAGGLG